MSPGDFSQEVSRRNTYLLAANSKAGDAKALTGGDRCISISAHQIQQLRSEANNGYSCFPFLNFWIQAQRLWQMWRSRHKYINSLLLAYAGQLI